MPYTMKTWSVVLFVFAVAISTSYAHFSSDCHAKKLRCPCTNGGYVSMIEEQCSVAGSCRPCRKRRKPCDQMVVALKCKQLQGKGAGILMKRRSLDNYKSGCTKDGRVHVMSNRTGPPTVTINGRSKEKFVDDYIVIKCTVKANPPAHIKWLFNGAAFTETQEKRYARGSCNESLTISSAELDDKGNFTCSATNDNGTASETVMVNVLVKKGNGPVISSFELDGEGNVAYLGGSINITCKAINANIIAFLNSSGGLISENHRFTINHFSVHDHILDTKLEIKNVSQADEGTYTCAAGTFKELSKTTMFLQTAPCPEDHYCPEGGNQAFRCPPGTCNNGKAPVVHQCSACDGGSPSADQKPRAEIPIKVTILSVVCVLLFLILILVIMIAAYLYYHKTRSVSSGRVTANRHVEECC